MIPIDSDSDSEFRSAYLPYVAGYVAIPMHSDPRAHSEYIGLKANILIRRFCEFRLIF